MQTNISGLSFGGNVWGYGSVDAFKAAYDAEAGKAAGAAAGTKAGVAVKTPKKAPKEPVDTGLTRYLGSTGNAEQKLAHLHEINKFVSDFQLSHKGDLPETKELNTLEELKKYLSPGDLAKKVLADDGGVAGASKKLAQMLEKKRPAAQQKVAGGSPRQLSSAEREKICRTALEKTFQAYTLERLSTFTSKGEQQDLATRDKNAILNTALGAAELLMDGRINENSVVTLLRDGSLIDLANTLDVTALLQKAAASAKEQFTQKTALRNAAQNRSLQEQNAIDSVIAARERFTKVLDFMIHEHDPSGKLKDAKFLPKQLEEVKLRLQQFRYDLERCTGDVGREFGHGKYSFYGIMEQLRRACSNLKGDRHLDVRFKTNAERDRAFADLQEAEGNLPNALRDEFGIPVADRAKKACQTTHAANDGARMSQATAAERRTEDEYAHKVLDLLHKTGGMQMTMTEISVSAVAEIGNDVVASGQASVGGYYRTSAAVVATKDGGYALVLSKEGGGRASATAAAAGSSVEAKVKVEGGGGKKTVLGFASQDELIAYCRKNCPNLLTSIPGSFTDIADRDLLDAEAIPRLKDSVKLVGAVTTAAKFIGNATGLRLHKTKNFNEANFEKRMRDAEVFDRLDGVLYRRRNGLAVSRTVSSTSSGEAALSAKAEVGTDAAGVQLSAGLSLGGTTSKIRTKGLKSVQAFVSMHTAGEMKKTVLPEAFEEFRAYQKDAPEKYAKSTVAADLEKFVKAEPKKGANDGTRAKFWSDQITALAGKYRDLEGAYSAPGGSKKEVKARQVDFARQTRLYALVNEYVAKRIESELKSAKSPAIKVALTSALKVARESLGATLARSNIELKSDVVQEHLQFGREVSGGKTSEFYVKAEVGWDVGIKKAESSAGTSGGEATNAAVSAFKNAFLDAMGSLKADGEKALKGLMGLSGKVSGKLTTTRYVEKGDSVKPWANTNAVTIDLDVGYPLGPLSLIETVVKLVEKAKAEPPADKGRAKILGQAAKEFAVEFGKQLGATALTEADKTAATLVSPITSMPMALLVGGLSKALAKAGIALGLSQSDTTSKGAKLTLAFEGGRFTQCKMSDYVSNTAALGIKAKAAAIPVAISFSKTDVTRREQVTFDTMPHATLGTVLSRGGGLLAQGETKFTDFLQKNQKAVNELMTNLRKTTGDGKVAYADTQLQEIRDGLENLTKLAKTDDRKVPSQMKKAAQAAYGAATKNWAELVKTPPDKETDAARNKLLFGLAGALLKGYGILDSAQQLGWSAPKGGTHARIK